MAASREEIVEEGISEPDVKIILLGDSAVGKSKLVERFLMDQYNPRQMSTYALTLYRYETEVDEKSVSVDFWDTAGQERFQSLHPSYYYRAQACILVFDVTRKSTYQNLARWYRELRYYCEGIPVFVVANKVDADMKVTNKTFNFASKINAPFYFCSASSGTNVVRVFQDAIRAAIETRAGGTDEFMNEVFELLDEVIAKDSAAMEAETKAKQED